MSINSTNISLPLRLTFFIFSMVLNCMGIVILQLSQENIGYDKLGFLEAFKDLPIAFISLFAVNFISKVGAKKSLILALSIVEFAHLFFLLLKYSGFTNFGLPSSELVLPLEKYAFTESFEIILP